MIRFSRSYSLTAFDILLPFVFKPEIFILEHPKIQQLHLPNKEFLQNTFRILTWGVVYYFIAWFSLTYFLDCNGVGLAWPPVGVYISAILLTPAKQRPFLIAVIFMADIAADMHTGFLSSHRWPMHV